MKLPLGPFLENYRFVLIQRVSNFGLIPPGSRLEQVSVNDQKGDRVDKS